MTDCVAHGDTAEEVLKSLIGRVAKIERERGITVDWLGELQTSTPAANEYTSREVVNAIGLALTKAGIENNLVK